MLRLVTTLTRDYVPGLAALLQSLRENAGIDWGLSVITYDAIDPATQENLGRLCSGEIRWIDVRDLGSVPQPPNQTPRMRPNFQKLLIWRLPKPRRGTLVYLDADMLCLSSLEGMESFPSLSVVRKQSSIGRPPDADTAYLPSGRYPWNAGMMVFRPSKDIFEGLCAQARSYVAPIRFGDQVIHNDYFNRERQGDVHYIDPQWNMSTWMKRKWPAIYSRRPVKLLHFAHAPKPWRHIPQHVWQVDFWKLWRGFYERSGFPPLAPLRQCREPA